LALCSIDFKKKKKKKKKNFNIRDILKVARRGIYTLTLAKIRTQNYDNYLKIVKR
jgi:hypothetical protein